MIKRLAAFILAALLTVLLAACNTASPDASSSLSRVEEAPPVVIEPAPPPPPVEPDQAFLTGLQRGPDYPADKRITAVMVNNVAISRPTRGLSQAKVVVEIEIEYHMTRMMALYEDYAAVPQIGSVRSARDQFFQILLPYWGFYIHDGPHDETHPMNWMLRDYDYYEFDLQPNTGSTYRIDRPGYTKVEFTEYTDAEHIKDAIENTSADDYRAYGSPIFNFGSYNDEPREPGHAPAEALTVVHAPNYRTLLEYDKSTERYALSMFSEASGEVEPVVDENNDEPVAFDNAIVVFAPMSLYADSELVKVDYSQGGAGYYFSQGRYEPILWMKGAPNEPLLFYEFNRSGEMVQVNPGTTYLAVVNDERLPDFEKSLQLGNAREIAAEGEVNPDREDVDD